jgi:putative oxidoreductase
MATLVGNIWAGRDVRAWRNVRAKCAPWAAVPLRLIVGYGFIAHGLAKWHNGPEAFAAILHALGVPAPHVMAWLTIATEILSGIAILAGGFVSLVSIPSIILLAVAVFTVHLPYGFSSIKLLGVSNGTARFGPPGYECNLLYIAAIVVLVLIGPTPWSVDNYRERVRLTSGSR